MMTRVDVPFRVVAIGEASVGKTSITTRLVENRFNPFEGGTIGANYQQYTEIVDGKRIEIQLWDTAGQEKFRSLGQIFFRDAAAAICVISLTSRSSFDNANLWINKFQEVVGQGPIVYLVANKSDLVDEFQVSIAEAREWAQQLGHKVFICSAKTSDGVTEIFKELARELVAAKASSNSVLTESAGGNIMVEIRRTTTVDPK